ncbi:MAG: orotate phosphoribosyltransferase [Cyanobacteria bacterium HKST-UBA04]|nr:orotate phosphoribosyltransferase [Cyanobacteria bacterium HKST-UBA04]MCA9841018.1 orotate phosphoribosyltransferase [Cyanobacteria bacterium HKST-UBA03]
MTVQTRSPKLQTLFEILSQRSFKRGTFTLASGKTSTYYMDGRLTTLSADGSKIIGELLFEHLGPLKLDAVGGMTMGADPIVTAVTVESARQGQPIDGFLVRKEAKGHGTKKQVEGNLKDGDRVVLLEDVMTTGGTVLQAAQAVRQAFPQVDIVKVVTLVDRNEGGVEATRATLAEAGLAYEALLTIEAFL